MIDVLVRKIEDSTIPEHIKVARENGEKFKAFYTGEGTYIEKLIKDYRPNESDNQKIQRSRITIRRTKHVCYQIENILDQLQTLDKAAVNIKIENESHQKGLEDSIYEMNIESQAFNFVKLHNITDPNSFIIGSIDELGEVVFDVIGVESVIDFAIKNERVKYLIVKIGEEKYRIYLEKEVIEYKCAIGKKAIEIDRYATGINYAYHLGFSSDPKTKFRTYKSILDPASEMLKQLTWDGSEYDVIKLLHGIIKQFVFAPKCTYHFRTEDDEGSCDNGQIFINGNYTQCPSCRGSGMRIHTSSQDVIFLPEPADPTNYLSLDRLTHIEFIPESILESRKNDLKQTEDAIIRTVFNSNNVTRNEVVKTATELTIDLQGVYSMLTKMGMKVSETFIWMCEVISDIKGYDKPSVFHGYSMDLNLDSVDNLFNQRTKAVAAGVSNDIISNIDMAILKKQHIDNPDYINRFETWETFKPFSDKTIQEKISIIAMLPDDNPDKVLYLYWNKIKTDIIFENPEFYLIDREQQKSKIEAKVKQIISEIKAEPMQPAEPDFDDV